MTEWNITPSPVPLTIPGNGKIEIDGFVVTKDGGHVVSSMNGVFDFTKIPDEYHGIVVNYLLRNRLSLAVRMTETPPPAPVEPSTPAAALATAHPHKPWWKFWSRA